MKVRRELNIPLYMQVYEALLEAIVEQKYAYGQYLPSERELSESFDVDRLTVRRALDMLVSEGLVEKLAGRGSRVRDLPTTGANTPAESGDARNLVFVMPELPGRADRLTEPFNTRLFERVQESAKRLGYMLAYTRMRGSESLEQTFRPHLPSGILFVSEVEGALFDEAARLGIPSVAINKHSKHFASVFSDRRHGSYVQVEHLVSMGHRRIILLNGEQSYLTAKLSLEGYRQAVQDHGLPPDDQIVVHSSWTFDAGYRAMLRLIDEHESLPSAVAASNDMIALGACEALKEQGFAVPGDVSVVGFDDIDQLDYFSPKLTTIRSNIDLIATAAWDLLIGAMMNAPAPRVETFVPTELVVRESTTIPNSPPEA